MFEDLRKQVKEANQRLSKLGLTTLTFGNLSAIDESKKFVAIKPSGVDYDLLKDEDIVIVNLKGEVIEGDKNPSLDTPTHLELYRNFEDIRAVIHTHSECATIFAQARRPIDCFGTTHADYFRGSIPVTRELTKQEIQNNYELNTGKVIVETFKDKLDYLEIPACLVSGHGPFVFCNSIKNTLENAVILEKIAKMNLEVLKINPDVNSIDKTLLDKHYLRKHGKNAYYGQRK